MTYQFKYITASGTFDRLHEGHKTFLRKAFELAKRVHIGITTDAFIKSSNKSYHELIESFEKRRRAVMEFLQNENVIKRAHVTALDDIYGPALEEDIEAILVTEDSKKGANLVNRKREEQGLSPLAIVRTPLVTTKEGKVISSTYLRRNLVLPKHVRPLLQKPLGVLLKGNEKDLQVAVKRAKNIIDEKKPPAIITVGDVVAKSFNQAHLIIDVAIVDFKIKREETIKDLFELSFTKDKPDRIVDNPPGTISPHLSEALEQALGKFPRKDKPFVIRVFGEEDLAVLPAIVYAPIRTLIFYGQPNEGIVMVSVDNAIKTHTILLLEKFHS